MPGITERRQGGDVRLGEGLLVLQRLERGQGSAVSSRGGSPVGVRSGGRGAGAEGLGQQDDVRPAWLEQTWEGPARLKSGKSRALSVMGFEGRASGTCSGVTCRV